MAGNVVIVSAPSGAGKSTILQRVLNVVPAVEFSISHTTRAPRQGEQDGVHYHFVTAQEFLAMRDQGEFLEWAEVHGNYYGTSRRMINKSLKRSRDVVLDIDVQGAAQVKKELPQAITIFIMPPSMAELERRLRDRGTDDAATIALRLENAARELADRGRYDYVVVNDALEPAVQMVQAILLANRAATGRDFYGTTLQDIA